MAPKPGALPPELEDAIVNANLETRGKENATTPPEQRAINPGYITGLSEGPIKGPDGEGFLPASYSTNRVIKEAGRPDRHAGIVRTDR